MLLILFLFVGISQVLAKGNVTNPSQCPKVNPMENFEFKAYAKGIWYETLRYPNEMETREQCIKLKYELQCNDTIIIKNTGISKKCAKNFTITVKRSPEAKTYALLDATLTTTSTKKTVPFPSRYVLDTDYENYSIVYDCKYDEKKDCHQEYVWILTRAYKLEEKIYAFVNKYINSTNIINYDKLIKIDNSKEACKAVNNCCKDMA